MKLLILKLWTLISNCTEMCDRSWHIMKNHHQIQQIQIYERKKSIWEFGIAVFSLHSNFTFTISTKGILICKLLYICTVQNQFVFHISHFFVRIRINSEGFQSIQNEDRTASNPSRTRGHWFDCIVFVSSQSSRVFIINKFSIAVNAVFFFLHLLQLKRVKMSGGESSTLATFSTVRRSRT
jgi:hypothetical protein